jgi:outer membrane receptor protein involved in Fe transport
MVTAAGFKSFSASGIVLNIDQEYVEPVQLALGNAAETVEVNADSVQVDTTDMQFSNIVDSSQMVELPLIGRNFNNLELTLPGVQVTDNRFTGTFSVNGSQAQQSEYLINGADTNDIALNDIVFTPNLDAIDQFNLLDGPLNAEYDRNSGGIVSATIKQGTNHFHGDAFEFYRDTFLNTQNFLQKTYSDGVLTSTVSPFHQNIFGGTIGGPILRNKLHFFAAYQGTRESEPEKNPAASLAQVQILT